MRSTASFAVPAPTEWLGKSTEDAAPASISVVPNVIATTKVIELREGLYSLAIGTTGKAASGLANLEFPMTQVTAPFACADMLSSTAASAGWFGPEGGAVALQIPDAAVPVFVTTCRLEGEAAVPLEIRLTRLDRQTAPTPVPILQASATLPPPDPQPAAIASPASTLSNVLELHRPAHADTAEPDAGAAASLQLEVRAHFEHTGDRRGAAGQWIGQRGENQFLEAFSIRPLETIGADEIEYKAFGPNGLQTPWVKDARLCGSRGQGIALTGFAVRRAASARDCFDIAYKGCFPVRIPRQPCGMASRACPSGPTAISKASTSGFSHAPRAEPCAPQSGPGRRQFENRARPQSRSRIATPAHDAR